MKHRIQVTQEDIERGERDQSCRCPVARALKRHFGIKAAVFRWNGRMSVKFVGRGDKVGPILVLPDEADNFVYAFDNGHPVSPFEFELER